MFLVTPLPLKRGVNFWRTLFAGYPAVVLYLATIVMLSRFGIEL